MEATISYDVLVIGAGIAGLSTTLHLMRQGVTKIALAHGPREAAATQHGAGLLFGGQVDNFTRVSHAHGDAFGARLWRFGDAGFDALAAYCAESGVQLGRGKRLRFITSAAEMAEAEKAKALMDAHGLAVALEPPSAELTPRVVAVQNDGTRAGVVDTGKLLEALEDDVRAVPKLSKVRRLTVMPSGVAAELDTGDEVKAEIAVVCAHLETGVLLPDLKEALVPYADQWSEIKLARAMPAWRGTVFTANHTYEWGGFTAPDVMRLGGGRYLRPMAGIEATAATTDARITAHLLGQIGKTFAHGDGASARITVAAREIRPCDELPVIGPMYGSGRALVATGFMGMGLTMGFMAGRCLASLVKHGKSDELPREIWPERLRTMGS